MRNSRKDTLKKAQIKELIFYCCLIALPILHYLIFYVAVNVNSILLAFKRYEITEIGYRFVWHDFSNFKDAISNVLGTVSMRTAVRNSLVTFLIAVFIQTPLALIFSFYIVKKLPAHKAFRVIIFIPSIIAGIILVTIFQLIADNIFPEFMHKAFGAEYRSYQLLVNVKTRFGALLFFHVFIGFGTSLLLYSGGMSGVSEELSEAIRLDGAGDFGEFIYVIMPSIWGTFVTFTMVQVAGIFTQQLALFDLYRANADSSVWTLGYYLFSNTVGLERKYDMYPYLSAMGLIFTLIAAPATLITKWALEKFGPRED